jgi:hypothetical protein
MRKLSNIEINKARENAKTFLVPIAKSANAYEKYIDPFLDGKDGYSFSAVRIEVKKLVLVSEYLLQAFPAEMIEKGELLHPYIEMVTWLESLVASDEPDDSSTRKEYSNYLKRAVAELDLVLMQEDDYRKFRMMKD